jgi:hypothetical protein
MRTIAACDRKITKVKRPKRIINSHATDSFETDKYKRRIVPENGWKGKKKLKRTPEKSKKGLSVRRGGRRGADQK